MCILRPLARRGRAPLAIMTHIRATSLSLDDAQLLKGAKVSVNTSDSEITYIYLVDVQPYGEGALRQIFYLSVAS